MLNRYARAFFTAVFTPLASALVRRGVSPDAVTLGGTLGMCLAALLLYPFGYLAIGTLVITLFVFSDTIDGIMARQAGRSGPWGAYLDSTLDRFGDAAVFGGLALWFFGGGDDYLSGCLALACLVLGSLVSYAKARAEGVGLTADVGIAARADRLVATLVTTFFVGVGLPTVVLTAVLALLALASAVTVVQRVVVVRRQALAAGPPATA